MARKTFVSVKRGLTQDPKHRERMGNRIWLFLHIVDRADFETGTVYDWRDKDEGEDMGLNWRTMQRQRQELDSLGYIKCELTGRGLNIVIYNWHNPRSYSGEAINPRPFAQQEAGEYADLGTQSTQESTQAPNTDLRTPSINPTIQKSQRQSSDCVPATQEKKPRTPAQQKADDEVRSVCTAFSEASRIPLPPNLFTKPSKNDAIQWLAPARRIINQHNGSSVDAVKWGTANHLLARLSIKALISVEYATKTYSPKPTQAQFKDY